MLLELSLSCSCFFIRFRCGHMLQGSFTDHFGLKLENRTLERKPFWQIHACKACQALENANTIVKAFSFLDMSEMKMVESNLAILDNNVISLCNMLSERVLHTCLTSDKLEKKQACDIVRLQVSEVQKRESEAAIHPVLWEKANAMLGDSQAAVQT